MMLKFTLQLAEHSLIPDGLIRLGIRLLCKQRLRNIHRNNVEELNILTNQFIERSCDAEIAKETDKANEQHYELPTSFFKLVLGKHLKYSCSKYQSEHESLSDAEKNTLLLYAKRAKLDNNQTILDLGCGWGSMSLYMAETYPESKIIAVSNSATQRAHIEEQAKSRNLSNLEVITCDVNQLKFDQQFDRVISVEMLEHVSNHPVLFKRIAKWTKPDGLIFIHIFSHILAGYSFEIEDDSDWMAKYFFTGGVMPSDKQFLYYQNDLIIKNHWILNGSHYEKTSNDWLKNLDANKQDIIPLLKTTYGKDYKKWLQRWRIFFMACAELFGYKHGNEWIVSHYLFTPRS